MVSDATVVGLGRSTHGAHELGALTHRIFRFLVEHPGFRSLAIEENCTTGIPIDEYLRPAGAGDLRALLADAHPQTGPRNSSTFSGGCAITTSDTRPTRCQLRNLGAKT